MFQYNRFSMLTDNSGTGKAPQSQTKHVSQSDQGHDVGRREGKAD